jgi:3-hydroxyacyl-CoA dehydrogenase/enoyl-CoA hydratase/3-hydroxybutyryl-CoA epimerase
MESLNFARGADGVAILTIDTPAKKMNLATLELGRELDAAVARIAADDAIKGAVITSAKADFMAGGDIHGMVAGFESLGTAAEVYHGIATPFSAVLRRLETSGKPFAAAINGAALGGGLELALACHFRVVADLPKLILGCPEVTIGLIPGAGATQRLPRLLGIKAAIDLLLDGKLFSPAQAKALGVVHEVVAASDLLEAARNWVLTKGDPVQPWDQKYFAVPGGAGFFNAGITSFFNATATSISVKTQHNLPAPIALLHAVAQGTAVPMEAGLRIEARQFTKLLLNPVARNIMRNNFVSKGECDKLAGRPKDVPTFQPKSVGVIGAGLMGAGIAQVSADAGLDVVLIDLSPEQAIASQQRIAAAYAKRVERGKLGAERAAAALARIRPTADYAALAECDLVVEAVFEDAEVKSKVYAKLAAVMKNGALLASNTSALPITKLADGVAQPVRFIGLHFFSPVERMPLVEVIRGTSTSNETLAQALDYIKLLRKTPIIVNDAPGFFTSRVITAYLFESIGMVGDGLAPAFIDNAARQAGFALGPLALMDELTLDLTYHATAKRGEGAGPSWKPPYGFNVLDLLVRELGRKGKRHGAGFYDYQDGKRTPWTGLREIYPPRDQAASLQEVKDRMLYIQALEAVRALEEGVIGNPGEADVGAVLGIGFPAHTGGVFSFIDTIGVQNFCHRAEQLAARFGARFRPTAGLKARAAADTRYYPVAAAR